MTKGKSLSFPARERLSSCKKIRRKMRYLSSPPRPRDILSDLGLSTPAAGIILSLSGVIALVVSGVALPRVTGWLG